jgi:RNA polymerase sigma factor (TIGR02999 family)
MATTASVNPDDTNALFSQLYQDLRTLAQAQIAPSDTLNTTALVHELYMRVSERDDLAFSDRRAFFAYAARAMRHLLVDRARARLRVKRGGGEHALDWDALQDHAVLVHVDATLELDDLLRRLADEDARSAQVLELHYFGGLTGEQIAEMLKLNRRTILRDLDFAKAYIRAHWAGQH